MQLNTVFTPQHQIQKQQFFYQPCQQQPNIVYTQCPQYLASYNENNKKCNQPNQLYSQFYLNVKETLYYENGDGQVFTYYNPQDNQLRLVTCIDISTLYAEKKVKAIQIIKFLAQLKHQCLQEIKYYHVIEDRLVYVEMEMPQTGMVNWKSFCKKKFSHLEILNIILNMTRATEFIHKLKYTHRDIHPSKIQQFQQNQIKLNPIGLPYNFKKLLKRDNFCGHVNYSAPELVLEQTQFNEKVDVWSIGCCLYYLIVKKDPFDSENPQIVKQNILKRFVDPQYDKNIPQLFRPIIEACLISDPTYRPTSSQLVLLIENVQRLHHSSLQQKSKNKNLAKRIKQQLQSYSQESQTDKSNNPQQTQEPVTKESSSPLNQTFVSTDEESILNSSYMSCEAITEQIKVKFQIYYDYEGNIYEGQLQDSQKEGLGKQIWCNGDIYNGQWRGDMMEGNGKYIFNSGNVYEGQFSNNKKHGLGKIVFSMSGDSYNGQWYEDIINGKGQYIYKQQNKLYEGDFVEGVPNGCGVMKCQQFQYQGQFKSGVFDGSGKLEDFQTNIKYEGQFQDGQMNGSGILVDLNKLEIFDGTFVNNKKQGFGKIVCLKSSIIVSGLWANDQLLQDGNQNQFFLSDEQLKQYYQLLNF